MSKPARFQGRDGMDSRVKPANDDLALCGAGSEEANPPIHQARE